MTSRIFRVVGPPGTGKTTYLARQAQVAAAKHSPSAVAICSMTRTAAREIGERDTGVPEENCTTLHAAALHALDLTGGDLAETPKAMRAFHTEHPVWAAGDDGRDEPEEAGAHDTKSGGPVHAAVMNHRARMTPETEWTDDERAYHAVWEDWKAQCGTRDFADLIADVLRDEVGHPTAPRVLLLDEAQDFSRLELALAMHWSRKTETTVIVGDGQQAIFSWRGADPHRLDAMEVAGHRVLEQSYRCPRAVADLAQRWVAQLPGPEIPWQARDADGTVDLADHALRDTDDTIGAARESMDAGHTTMILATCRYMLTPLVASLRADGVPFHNPWSDEAAWNPLGTKGARALLAYLRPTVANEVWTWGDLWSWTEPLQATRFERGAKTSIEEHCRTDEFGQSRAGQTVELATMVTLLGEPATDAAMAQDVAWWEGALLASADSGARYPLAVLGATGAAGLARACASARDTKGSMRDAGLLKVGTVHSTKGSEADRVFLAPELSKVGFYEGWHGAGRDGVVRLGYVAATRAREHLTILEAGCPESMPLDHLVRFGDRVAA